MENKHSIEEIQNSMKGHEKNGPSPDLFGKIENRIKTNSSKMPMNFVKLSIAASLVILLVNISVVMKSSNNSNTDSYESNTELISDFNLYE